MESPLKGKVTHWLRENSDTGEITYPKIIQTLKDYAKSDGLTPKCADGLFWQGQIDSTTPIRTLKNIRDNRVLFADNGMAYVPVVVPRGVDPIGEANFHAQIGNESSGLIVDLEPYTGFWDKSPLDRIVEYAEQLRREASGYLILQPDPRQYGIDGIRFDAISGYFNGLMAQHYVGWVDAQVNWSDVNLEVQRFRELIRRSKLDPHVTLYGVNRTDLAIDFYNQIKSEVIGVNVFAFGTMNGAQLRQFSLLEKPSFTEKRDCDELQRKYDVLIEQYNDLAEEHKRLTFRAGLSRKLAELSWKIYDDTPDFQYLDAGLSEIKNEREKTQ